MFSLSILSGQWWISKSVELEWSAPQTIAPKLSEGDRHIAVKLFISHSERDEALIRPLAGWLQTGLGLKDEEVRCTSLSNMDVGVIPVEELRKDLISAEVVVGLITANSLRSNWAQFEMGAGWLQKHLHTIRGPGIPPEDLPSPFSEFVTVGCCERESMSRLLVKLAGILETPVNSEADAAYEVIAKTAKKRLGDEMVGWFSLPPVLSAERIDSVHYSLALSSLCTLLELQPLDLHGCTTPRGFITRDPDQLPKSAKELWTISKDVVNFMLSGSAMGSDDFRETPVGVLDDVLVADMKLALKTRRNRATKIRTWFADAAKWISENPPSDRRSGHSPSRHP